MKALHRSIVLIVAFTLLSVSAVWATGAQEAGGAADYPTQPIQLVVPANPGGGTDLGARLLAKYLTPVLESPVVVMNMAGAGGTVAQDFVLDSDSDGYTVLYFHEAFVANRVHGLTDTNLRDDFVAVGGAYVVDTVCLYSKEFKTWDDMIAAAREREVLFGSEVGAAFHIAFEAMKAGLGLDNMRFVDTGAVTPTLAAMEGDQIDIAMVPMGVIRDSVAAGRLNVLAFFSSKERSQFAPEIPTMTELGVNVYMPKFYFMAMPPGTPEERAEILRTAVRKVAADPDFIAEAKKLFYTPGYLSPEDLYEMEEVNYDLMTTFIDKVRG
jgi:putative tricarboxylic transport membrane protein